MAWALASMAGESGAGAWAEAWAQPSSAAIRHVEAKEKIHCAAVCFVFLMTLKRLKH